jgi:hypothetical protein
MNNLPGIDWRDEGVVTPVKNAGDVNNNWCFAITGLTEASIKIKQGTLHSLSEQQLLDCVKVSNQELIVSGLNYTQNMGLLVESAYPYTSHKGECRNPDPSPYAITGFSSIKYPSNIQIYQLLENAPLIGEITLNESLLSYTSGIYNENEHYRYHACHVKKYYLLIVGFTTDNLPNPYFICKASFGVIYGNSGYIYIDANSKVFKKVYYLTQCTNK